MTKPTDTGPATDRALEELIELGVSLARTLQARALAAESSEAKAELGIAFHNACQSVHETLALAARLERDRSRETRARERRPEASDPAEPAWPPFPPPNRLM